MDDLLKSNMDNIKRVFSIVKRGLGSFIRYDDLLPFISRLNLTQYNKSANMDTVTLAWAFSKM